MPAALPIAQTHLDLVLLAVLSAVSVLLIIAYHSQVPYPILLVVGGAALGFIPGIPDVQLNPDVVLVIVLPPLLYAAAFFSSLRDVRDEPGLDQPAGHRARDRDDGGGRRRRPRGHRRHVVAGGVRARRRRVARPTRSRRRRSPRASGAPRRYLTIVEGEALLNDATALVAYKFAVAAVVSGSFSLAEASGRFVLNAVVGVAIGLAVGFVVARLRKALDDAPTEITISLVTPYFAYLPAEALGVSAVLAAVTAGIYLGWRSPELITPATRIQAFSVWEILVFVLNAALFMLVGLQLPSVMDGISGLSTGAIVGYAVAVSAAVIVMRFLWVFPSTYLPRLVSRRIREREPAVHWHFPAIVAWTGMRGAVSLAAALAIPTTIDARRRLPAARPHHLPHLRGDPGHADPAGDDAARCSSACWASRRTATPSSASPRRACWPRAPRSIGSRSCASATGCATTPRTACAACTTSASGASRRASTTRTTAPSTARSQDYQRLRRKVLEAERAEIIRLRNVGKINDEIMRRIERDLDLEDTRLEV